MVLSKPNGVQVVSEALPSDFPMPGLLDKLKAKLSPEDFAELCEAIRTLDSSLFNDAMLALMKPVAINWDDVPDEIPNVTPIETAHAYREMAEEQRIDWLVRATRNAIVKAVPEKLRRWVLLRVIIDLDE